MPNPVMPLTESQVAAWRNRIHKEYDSAWRAVQRAAYREKLYRRYIRRHYGVQPIGEESHSGHHAR